MDAVPLTFTAHCSSSLFIISFGELIGSEMNYLSGNSTDDRCSMLQKPFLPFTLQLDMKGVVSRERLRKE